MKDNSWIPVVVLAIFIVAGSAVIYNNTTIIASDSARSASEKVVSVETSTQPVGVAKESDTTVTAEYHRLNTGVELSFSASMEMTVFYWAGPENFSYPPKSIKLKPDGDGSYKAKISFNGSDSVLDGAWCAWVVEKDGSVKLVRELPPKSGNEGIKCQEFPK